MANKESWLSSSSKGQFQIVNLKLPSLNDQDIKTQVQQTHNDNFSLVLRQPLLVSICHILKPATSFVDSVLLDKKESENGTELETTNFLEINSTLSELNILVVDGFFNTRTLLERKSQRIRIRQIDSMPLEFAAISKLKTLAEHDYFMYPTLMMERTANNASLRFDEIDLHMVSMDLLKLLQPLSWDAKAINAMGCFVFKFLEFLGFLLHGPNQPTTELASSMATLRENHVSLVESPLEQMLLPIDELNNLMKLTLEVIEYISKLTLLSDTEYNKEDLLSTCAYWAILSVIICNIQITLLMKNGEVALELSQIISNLSHNLDDLKRHYTICKLQIEEMEIHLEHIAHFEDAFSSKKELSDTTSKMSELMKSFMYSKDGCHSFIDGSTMSKVDLEVLNDKAVIFLISDLNMEPQHMTADLQTVYEQIKEEDYYKIIWVPFALKWTEEERQKFENLKSKMPWYIVSYDSPIAGVWYIKGRQIFFKGKPSYLIIDLQHGNQYPNTSPNCFGYLLDIVEAEQFPFKRINIEALRTYSLPPSLQLVYQEPHDKHANQKKPSSGFQGLVSMCRSRVAS